MHEIRGSHPTEVTVYACTRYGSRKKPDYDQLPKFRRFDLQKHKAVWSQIRWLKSCRVGESVLANKQVPFPFQARVTDLRDGENCQPRILASLIRRGQSLLVMMSYSFSHLFPQVACRHDAAHAHCRFPQIAFLYRIYIYISFFLWVYFRWSILILTDPDRSCMIQYKIIGISFYFAEAR